MMTLPLVLRGDVRPFVIVGGGPVAARKADTLVKAGAEVLLIAPQVTADIQSLADDGALTLALREAQSGEVFRAGSFVVLATNDADTNQQLAEQARAQHCFVCRTDQPDDNDFIFPAVIDRSPLMVSVSTRGSAPALTRHIRQRLEAFIPQDYGRLAGYAESLRERVKSLLPKQERAAFWRRWLNSRAPEMILARQPQRAEAETEACLQGQQMQGEVALVGAGPGDPDLLTFRALRLIQSADVVFYDRLVGDGIMDLVDPAAEKYYVGKKMSHHSVPQDDINQLLIHAAQEGKRVLRLKGGDPFIFGRGGEEIQQLAGTGIPFQVVPGITAASGCAAYAGIPLTHRDYAQSVRFVTGHLKNGTCNLPWNELIHPDQTLVIYMGLNGLPVICSQLIAAGMPPETPVALVEKGTLPEQKVHIGTLSSMPQYIEGREIHAPTLTIVGDVVRLHETLKWRP
ncbi:MAG: uroporphyrinogen-III C-methyltransferase [Oceanospirillaceae bacterium]|nr:uroporphyrinogen-III C-methyltransferase [Oceanospirillaceae bacterium]MBT11063.1 uroporphyrinogen-III C-methyltransferase [Oceanospirillaceae bacterium]|tara:strand:+ start:247439 stop:248809 length:1371 start_codon:yes stop_codon:yes gene_type:complete